MIENLCEIVYKMYNDYSRDKYTTKEPQLVMLCSPETYWKIREEEYDKIKNFTDTRIRYERDVREYGIPILYIIGIKVPVVIRNDMPENVQFQIMYREDYERLEKEEMDKKFMAMWEKY